MRLAVVKCLPVLSQVAWETESERKQIGWKVKLICDRVAICWGALDWLFGLALNCPWGGSVNRARPSSLCARATPIEEFSCELSAVKILSSWQYNEGGILISLRHNLHSRVSLVIGLKRPMAGLQLRSHP